MKSWRGPVFLGLALMVLQLGWVLWLATDGHPWTLQYGGFCTWDAGWYSGIVQHGYVSVIPPVAENGDLANVAFFPGFPYGARWLAFVSGLDACHSLAFLAQASAWVFWVYFLLFLRWAGVSRFVTACAVGALLFHPGAFFMVVGYSESLFMAGLMGFLYWAARERWLSAGLHGFVMAATRLAGLPAVAAPLLQAALARGAPRPVRRFLGPGVAGGIASLGGLLFFVYCRLRFGYWDLYMWTVRVGWKVKTDWSAIYTREVYVLSPLTWVKALKADSFALGQAAVPLVLGQFAIMGVMELAWARRAGGRSRWRQRVALYGAAWLMFHLSVCGRWCLWMMGMIRYVLPTHALLVLALAHLLADGPRAPVRPWLRAVLGVLLAAWLALMGYEQYWMAWRHVHWQWAA